MRRLLAAVFAAATIAIASGVTAAPAAATDYAACNGVWVIVDYGSLGGGVSTRCATSFSTGRAALSNAGYSPTLDNGFLLKIKGKPGSPDPQAAYWSYWQATRRSDGTYGAWKYATTGANSTHPVKGNAEGWHYVTTSGNASPPGTTPAKNPVAAASSAPTTKASAKPTAGSSASASSAAKPGATSAVPRTSSAAPRTGSASPSPSGAVTSPSAPSPTEAPSADPPGMDVPAGSPIAVIATTSALAVGAAGAGGWWLWKGRRR